MIIEGENYALTDNPGWPADGAKLGFHGTKRKEQRGTPSCPEPPDLSALSAAGHFAGHLCHGNYGTTNLPEVGDPDAIGTYELTFHRKHPPNLTTDQEVGGSSPPGPVPACPRIKLHSVENVHVFTQLMNVIGFFKPISIIAR